MANRRNWQFTLNHQFGSTVSVVRNAIVDAFLESRADLLLMIDSDQGVLPDMLERMIDFGKPVVGCMSPKRGYKWSNVRLETVTNVSQVIHQASQYVGGLLVDDKGQAPLINGFAPAEHVGTGVLLVTRAALEQMMNHFPELKGRGFTPETYSQRGAGGRWGFFNPMDNEEGVPMSEDISFCRRWRQTGGEIWVDIVSPVMHVGRHVFEGSFLDYLEANR